MKIFDKILTAYLVQFSHYIADPIYILKMLTDEADYTSIFQHVSTFNDLSFAQYIIEHKADKIDDQTYSATFKTAANSHRSSNKDFAKYLLTHSDKIDDQTHNFVFQNVVKDNDAFAKYLVSYHINSNIINFDTAALAAQNLINSGSYNLLKEIVSHYQLNNLDTNSVMSGIYKAAREGEVNILRSLSDKLNIEEMTVNPKKNFFNSTIDECFGARINLENVNFSKDNSPKAIAQNFCSTMFMYEDSILKIEGYEALDVINYLLDNSFIPDSYNNTQNTLTAYLNPGHSFFGISSESENFIKGFYPRGSSDSDRMPNDDSVEMIFYSVVGAITYSVTYLGIALLDMAINKAAGFNILGSHFSYVYAPIATSLAMSYISDNYDSMIMPHIDHKIGHIANEVHTGEVTKSDTNNYLKIKLFLTDEEIIKAIDYVHLVEQNCNSMIFEHCTYNVFTRNCIDFTRDVHTAATHSDANILRLFSYEQLYQYETDSFENLYNTKGLAWVYIKNSFEDVIDTLEDNFEDIKNTLRDGLEDAKITLEDSFESIQDTLEDNFEDVKITFEDIQNTLEGEIHSWSHDEL